MRLKQNEGESRWEKRRKRHLWPVVNLCFTDVAITQQPRTANCPHSPPFTLNLYLKAWLLPVWPTSFSLMAACLQLQTEAKQTSISPVRSFLTSTAFVMRLGRWNSSCGKLSLTLRGVKDGAWASGLKRMPICQRRTEDLRWCGWGMNGPVMNRIRNSFCSGLHDGVGLYWHVTDQ